MKKLSLIVFMLLMALTVSFSQSYSTKGTEFWFCYLDNLDLNYNYYPRFSVVISADSRTNVNISVAGRQVNINTTLEADEIKEIFLPVRDNLPTAYEIVVYYPSYSETIENLGIHITSDKPVSVYCIHYRIYFAETSIVLPVTELGPDYQIIAGRDYNQNQIDPSELIIVATKDNSQIEITPSTTTKKLKPKNVPFVIKMDAGQVYQVKSTCSDLGDLYDPCTEVIGIPDLTGTKIRELKKNPVAVFSGSKAAYTLVRQSANSHLYDQCYPISRLGTIYPFLPFKDQGGDIVKILSLGDSNKIYFDCDSAMLLNSGEFRELMVTKPTIITSDSKIEVSELEKTGETIQDHCGDPSFLNLPPLNLKSKKAIFSYTYSNTYYFIDSIYLNIVMPTNAISNIRLDNVSIINDFTSFPGNSYYSYAQIQVGFGKHIVESTEGFWAFINGCGWWDAITNHLGYEYSDEFAGYGLTLPDTVIKADSRYVEIPLSFNVQLTKSPVIVKSLKLKLKWNPGNFELTGLSTGTYTLSHTASWDVAYLNLTDLSINQNNQIVTYLKGNIYTGFNNFTTFQIDEITIDSQDDIFNKTCGKVKGKTGTLEIVGCALNLSKYVSSIKPSIEIQYLNDESLVELKLNNLKSKICQLSVFNIQAIKLDHRTITTLNKNEQSVILNIESYPTGIYQVVFQSPEELLTKTFVVVK